ncbi:hypothetical protein [Citrobacter freundii]|uniref:hypothetical protein n=1 Tax=Citrobacter freundii TaxID=546 RepID=UPI003CC7C46F
MVYKFSSRSESHLAGVNADLVKLARVARFHYPRWISLLLRLRTKKMAARLLTLAKARR